MAPPTRDEDEREPGQAAEDRVREETRRALYRFDLHTNRELEAYEAAEDRESQITQNFYLPAKADPVLSGRPPKPLANFLSWFPYAWRPRILLALVIIGLAYAWTHGGLGAAIGAALGGLPF